jgi:tetratricopeptide (TPR) repeat protein
MMTKLLSGLLLCLALCAPAAAQTARDRARDADPLAEAFRVASRVLTESGREHSLVFLVNMHARAGRLDEALRAASAIEENWTKAVQLCRLANSLAESGQLERAAEVMSVSLGLVEHEDSYGFAEGVLSEMLGGESRTIRDIRPRSERREGLAGRLIKAGRGAEVAPLLERARAVAVSADFEEDKAVAVLAGVARRYAELGERERADAVLSEALRIARGMEKRSDGVEALATLARVRAAGGDTKGAAAVLDEALKAVPALDEADRQEALGQVARSAAESGLYELAQTAAGGAGAEQRWGMLAPACRNKAASPAACRKLLTAAVEAAAAAAREGDGVRDLTRVAADISLESVELLEVIHGEARALKAGDYRAEVLAAVGDQYAALGQPEKASEVWREALQAARAFALTRTDFHPGDSRVNGDRERIELLRGLARRFVTAGQTSLALECAQALEANHAEALGVAEGSVAQIGDAGEPLAEVADELLRAGRRAEAREVLAAAARVTGRASENFGEFRRAGSLASLAAAYARAGDEPTAAAYFERALRLAQRSREYPAADRTVMLIHIAAKYAEAGMQPGPAARKTLRRLVRDIADEND